MFMLIQYFLKKVILNLLTIEKDIIKIKIKIVFLAIYLNYLCRCHCTKIGRKLWSLLPLARSQG